MASEEVPKTGRKGLAVMRACEDSAVLSRFESMGVLTHEEFRRARTRLVKTMELELSSLCGIGSDNGKVD